MAPTRLGLDPRHRDKNGLIGRKHGNTLIATLRLRFGEGFAKGQPANARLADVLYRLDELSLGKLIKASAE
jgi:hypothetical protein